MKIGLLTLIYPLERIVLIRASETRTTDTMAWEAYWCHAYISRLACTSIYMFKQYINLNKLSNALCSGGKQHGEDAGNLHIL